jgi:hypothetical protein
VAAVDNDRWDAGVIDGNQGSGGESNEIGNDLDGQDLLYWEECKQADNEKIMTCSRGSL